MSIVNKSVGAARYRYVVVIGVDGMGAFCKDSESPNIRRIFKNGAIAYDCMSVYPTGSAECWGTMLMGVMPDVHKLTNYFILENPNPGTHKTIFRLLLEQKPNTHAASFCSWNSINRGIVEEMDGVTRERVPDFDAGKRVESYIEEKGVPELLFIQLNAPDGSGHKFGYGTKDHLVDIDKCDGYIGEVYDAYQKAGVLDDTLFIVTSDHGGTHSIAKDGTSSGTHGGNSDREMKVFFGAVGKGVKNTVLKSARIQDIPAIVCYALGIIGNVGEWESIIPEELFDKI